MPERYRDLEARIERLMRYLELLDDSIKDLKEQIEIRDDLDKAENIVLRLANSLRCRKKK